jgi:hypothetical protein
MKSFNILLVLVTSKLTIRRMNESVENLMYTQFHINVHGHQKSI